MSGYIENILEKIVEADADTFEYVSSKYGNNPTVYKLEIFKKYLSVFPKLPFSIDTGSLTPLKAEELDLLIKLIAFSPYPQYDFEYSAEQNAVRLRIFGELKGEYSSNYLDKLWSSQISVLFATLLEIAIEYEKAMTDDREYCEEVEQELLPKIDEYKSKIAEIKSKMR